MRPLGATILTWLADLWAWFAGLPGTVEPYLDWLKQHKDGLGGLQSVVTVLATLIGAYWAIRRFGWTREGYARANVDAAVTCKRLDASTTLVSVAVSIDNKGLRRVRVRDGWVEVQQVLPLALTLPAGGTLLEPGRRRVRWPPLGEHRFVKGHVKGKDPNETRKQRRKNEKTKSYLDPGERDVLTFEFVIPAEVTVIKAWGHLKDPQTGSGYLFETLVDVDAPSSAVVDAAVVV